MLLKRWTRSPRSSSSIFYYDEKFYGLPLRLNVHFDRQISELVAFPRSCGPCTRSLFVCLYVCLFLSVFVITVFLWGFCELVKLLYPDTTLLFKKSWAKRFEDSSLVVKSFTNHLDLWTASHHPPPATDLSIRSTSRTWDLQPNKKHHTKKPPMTQQHDCGYRSGGRSEIPNTVQI